MQGEERAKVSETPMILQCFDWLYVKRRYFETERRQNKFLAGKINARCFS